MPETRARRRRWFIYGVMLSLGIVVAVLSVISFILNDQLNNAEARLTRIEAQNVARETATKVGEIATCYASARGRPQILIVFRGLAAKLGPNPRTALNELIDRYETTTPTLAQCDAKAKAEGFSRKDFPPQTRGEQSRP